MRLAGRALSLQRLGVIERGGASDSRSDRTLICLARPLPASWPATSTALHPSSILSSTTWRQSTALGPRVPPTADRETGLLSLKTDLTSRLFPTLLLRPVGGGLCWQADGRIIGAYIFRRQGLPSLDYVETADGLTSEIVKSCHSEITCQKCFLSNVADPEI